MERVSLGHGRWGTVGKEQEGLAPAAYVGMGMGMGISSFPLGGLGLPCWGGAFVPSCKMVSSVMTQWARRIANPQHVCPP